MKFTKRQLRLIDPPRETDIPTVPVRKFTVAEYEKMLAVGIFRSGDPYELLRGWIVPKLKRSPRNSLTTGRLRRRMMEMILDGQWLAGAPFAITFRGSQPEPACCVVRGPDDEYWKRHPRANETELIAEVADDSLERDRGIKMDIYASGKVPIYWIVNIPERRVEVYTDPRGGKKPTYRTRTEYAPGQAVPVTVAGKTLGSIPVSELLP
jgi:hypothetical protein